MDFKEMDLTVSQIFANGFKSPASESRLFRNFSQTQPTLPKQLKALQEETCPMGIHESRMQNQDETPMILSGNRAEREFKESIRQAVSSHYCDFCGCRIQRKPWEFRFMAPRLCYDCAIRLKKEQETHKLLKF